MKQLVVETMLLALWIDTLVGLIGTPQLSNPRRQILVLFCSLPLHLIKSRIVGLTMPLSLSVLAKLLATAIIFRREIAINPMALQNAISVGYWKVFELHFMTLVYPDAVGT